MTARQDRNPRAAMGPAGWRHAAVPGAVDAEYWTDLQPFRHELVSQVRAAWDAFSADIDGAVRENPLHDVSSVEADNTQEGT